MELCKTFTFVFLRARKTLRGCFGRPRFEGRWQVSQTGGAGVRWWDGSASGGPARVLLALVGPRHRDAARGLGSRTLHPWVAGTL